MMGPIFKLQEMIFARLGIKIGNDSQRHFWSWINRTDRYMPERYENKRFTSIWNSLISDINVKGCSVFDYGCSNGVWSMKYKKMGADVTGIDYIHPPLYREGLILADISEFVSDKKADLIHTARVVMHLNPEKQERTIKLIRHNLKDNGRLVMIEMNKDTSLRIWGREWENLLMQHGFRIDKVVHDNEITGVLATKVN